MDIISPKKQQEDKHFLLGFQVQCRFHFLFAPTVPESGLSRLWQAAKVEDLNVNPTYNNTISENGHLSN